MIPSPEALAHDVVDRQPVVVGVLVHVPHDGLVEHAGAERPADHRDQEAVGGHARARRRAASRPPDAVDVADRPADRRAGHLGSGQRRPLERDGAMPRRSGP